MCLNCSRPICTNCLDSLRSVYDSAKYIEENVHPNYDARITARDAKVIFAYQFCGTDKEIAGMTGLSPAAVTRAREKLGLPPAVKFEQIERKEIVRPWLER